MSLTEAVIGAEVAEGWTTVIPFRLEIDGVPAPCAGMTVTWVLRDCDHALVTTGAIAWINAAIGHVGFKPATGTLLFAKSPYRYRFKVTDGAGDAVLFPNDRDDLLLVRET